MTRDHRRWSSAADRHAAQALGAAIAAQVRARREAAQRALELAGDADADLDSFIPADPPPSHVTVVYVDIDGAEEIAGVFPVPVPPIGEDGA
ncbi:hypothetical protein KF840_22410 [bacterium]|nr:hypothetical protein [bacterium]